MKILIYDLPEKEVVHIKRNCKEKIEKGEVLLHEWQTVALTSVRDEWKKIKEKEEVPDIVISKNGAFLRLAIDAGVSTIAYQNKEAKMPAIVCQGRENDISAGTYQDRETEMLEQLPPVDILVEGFEEVDFVFFERVWQRHHHIPWTILETERLIVRELALDDLDDLFELYSYKGMTDYMEGLYPYEEEYAYQKAYIENMYGFFGYGMWLVFEKESGKLVGRAGVEHREVLDGELELGYAIGTPWQGKGFATEVCEGILKYVQEELYFDEIVSLVEPENKVSVHVLEKLGFLLETELDLDGIHYKKYKKCFDPL